VNSATVLAESESSERSSMSGLITATVYTCSIKGTVTSVVFRRWLQMLSN